MRAALAWNGLESALELPAGSEVTYCDPGEWEVCDTHAERRVRVVAILPGSRVAEIQLVARDFPMEAAPGQVLWLAGRGWRHG